MLDDFFVRIKENGVNHLFNGKAIHEFYYKEDRYIDFTVVLHMVSSSFRQD